MVKYISSVIKPTTRRQLRKNVKLAKKLKSGSISFRFSTKIFAHIQAKILVIIVRPAGIKRV